MTAKYQFYMRLAFLGICAVTLICMTVLVGCGHNGGVTNTLLGISAALFGVNFWQIFNGNKPE